MTETMNINTYEEIALNAWPALRTYLYDGWVLRTANGFTRRANSIIPIYPAKLPMEEKIAFCEDFYAKAGLPTVFKLTGSSVLDGLEAALVARGYARETESSFQLLPLAEAPSLPEKRLAVFTAADPGDWLRVYAAFQGLPEQDAKTFGRMLNNLAGDACHGLLLQDGLPVACGLTVATRGYVGFFDIHVQADKRGQGLGKELMLSLMAWARRRQCSHGFLQVLADNEAANGLYAGLGFMEQYRYWYRVRK